MLDCCCAPCPDDRAWKENEKFERDRQTVLNKLSIVNNDLPEYIRGGGEGEKEIFSDHVPRLCGMETEKCVTHVEGTRFIVKVVFDYK